MIAIGSDGDTFAMVDSGMGIIDSVDVGATGSAVNVGEFGLGLKVSEVGILLDDDDDDDDDDDSIFDAEM